MSSDRPEAPLGGRLRRYLAPPDDDEPDAQRIIVPLAIVAALALIVIMMVQPILSPRTAWYLNDTLIVGGAGLVLLGFVLALGLAGNRKVASHILVWGAVAMLVTLGIYRNAVGLGPMNAMNWLFPMVFAGLLLRPSWVVAATLVTALADAGVTSIYTGLEPWIARIPAYIIYGMVLYGAALIMHRNHRQLLQQRDELASDRADLEGILEVDDEALIVTDDAHRIRWYNGEAAHAARLLGRGLRPGDSLWSVLPKKDAHAAMRFFAELHHQGRRRATFTYRVGGVQRVIRVSAARVIKTDGSHISIRLADITTHSRIEDRFRQALGRERNELVNLTAHELNTPLTPAMVALHILEKSLSEPTPQQEKAIARVRGSLERIQEAVQDMATAARALDDSLSLDSLLVDMHDAVTMAADSLRSRAKGRGLRVDLDLDRSAVCSGDPKRLQQAVRNLLALSLQRAPPDSTLDVSVHESADAILLRFGDRGSTLDAEARTQLQQIGTGLHVVEKALGGGWGVGLYVARHIIDAHGGTFEAVPRTGGGMVFVVRLPLGVETARRAKNRAARRTRRPRGRRGKEQPVRAKRRATHH